MKLQEKDKDKIRRWLAEGYREEEQPDGSILKIKLTPDHERTLTMVLNWPEKKAPTQEEKKTQDAKADAKLEAQINWHSSVEALSWLQAPHHGIKSFSGGPGDSDPQYAANAKALKLVKELYELGAVKVVAVSVSGYLDNDDYQDTDKLIIQLPQNQAQRKQLFKWANNHARERGYGPTPNVEQQFLLIWWD